MVKAIAWALCFLLGAWIIYSIAFQEFGLRPTPLVVGFGSGAQGSLSLPVEEVNAEIDRARSRMVGVNETGRALVLGELIAGWLSFAAMAAVTLIAGYYGQASHSNLGQITNAGNLPSGVARKIAFLAALAAVLTGAGQLAGNQGRDYYDRANEIAALINEARRQLDSAQTAADEQAVLDNLKIKAVR